MEVELKSDWQDTQVELLKSLHGYEVKKVNAKNGSIDYVAENEDGGKKLLRVIVGPKFHASTAGINTVEKTVEELEEGYYDEALLVAEKFTSVSKRLLRKESNLEYLSPGSEYYSLFELREAIYKQTRELCEAKCGKLPRREEDCNGYQNGRYTCPVRRVSDEADFHVERSWRELLKSDFDKLVKLRREMKQ